MNRRLAPLLVSAASCIASPQEPVEVPLFVAGSGPVEDAPARDGVVVTLSEARLAFGPLYLCAGSQAGELCDTARVEWLESTVVDVLSDDAAEVGTLTGISGPVRSFMYDLGLVSLTTREEPLVMPAAEALDGSSIVLSGVARVDDLEVPFSAELPVAQEEETETGVPVVRSAAGGGPSGTLDAGTEAVLVRFDATPWVADLDLRGLLEDEVCSVGGPDVVCAGMVEQSCNPDGSVADTRDCVAQGQICIVETGCVDSVLFSVDSQGGRSIRNQVVAGPRPTFDLDFSPP